MHATTAHKAVRLLGLAARRLVVDPRDAVLSARLAWWVILVSGLARVMPLPRAYAVLAVAMRPRATATDADRADAPARLARALDRLLALDLFMFRPSCWRRAMVLHRFLALYGIESRINFGVQRHAGGTLRGHAWLEHCDQPLLEAQAEAYTVTFSLPRTAASGSSRRSAAARAWESCR